MTVTIWLIYTSYIIYIIWRLRIINTFKYEGGKDLHIVTGLGFFSFRAQAWVKNDEPLEPKANHRTFHPSSILPFSGTGSDETVPDASCTRWMLLFTWPAVASCFCHNYNQGRSFRLFLFQQSRIFSEVKPQFSIDFMMPPLDIMETACYYRLIQLMLCIALKNSTIEGHEASE